jgi:hypothetical protein
MSLKSGLLGCLRLPDLSLQDVCQVSVPSTTLEEAEGGSHGASCWAPAGGKGNEED